VAVFVELTQDAFDQVFQQTVASSRAGNGGRYGAGKSVNVRRPVRGLEIKDDTYCCAKVVTAAGDQLPLFDSGGSGGRSTSYANFLLQSVTEARMEKQQIVETFGDPYIFFFGEQPRFLDVNAILINSYDFNWHGEWWENYDNYLRGSKLTEMGSRLYLFYDDVVVEGYMLMATTTMSSDGPLFATLSFRLFVTNYSNISLTGSDYFPIRASSLLYTSVDLTGDNSSSLLEQANPDPSTPVSQQVLNQQAYLALLQQTGGIQASEEEDLVGLQQSLTAQQQGIAAQQALNASSPQSFGGGGLLVAMLRQGLTSSSFPAQNVEGFIDNTLAAFGAAMQSAFGGPTPDPGLIRELPIRSKITDNKDEYLSWAGTDAVNPPVVSNPSDVAGTYSPVGGEVYDPVYTLSQFSASVGAELDASAYYGFNMVPYSPGQGFISAGTFGRPSGAGAGFSASVGTSGGTGLSYYPGVAGGVGLGVGNGIGGSAGLINALQQGNSGFFGGGLGPPGGVGIVPGVGYGYGKNFGAGFSRSFGYTAGAGGAYGGGMGGSFGPGIGGGLGGWGSGTYGNPLFPQSGNPLVQNFLQSPYGQPTGTPFGLPITSDGSNTQSVYAYTAGVAANGTLQSQAFAGGGFSAGAGVSAGFGATSVLGPSVLFDGGPDSAAVASFGPGISGDGAFALQAVPGTYDPTEQSGGLGV